MRNVFLHETWYIMRHDMLTFKHYFLKKTKALRIPLNGALITLAPDFKRALLNFGQILKFWP